MKIVVEYYDQKLNARVTERLMILGNEKILGNLLSVGVALCHQIIVPPTPPSSPPPKKKK